MADVIFEEQEVSGFTYNGSVGVYQQSVTPAPFILELEKVYKVNYDDAEYECTSFVFSYGEYEMIAIGNTALAGGEDTGAPFAIAYNPSTDYVNFFATTDAASHTIAIYEESTTEDTPTETSKGVDIILYDRTGAAVPYIAVDELETDTVGSDEKTVFTHGVAVENAEYEADFAEGNQKVTLEKGQLLKEFTVVKPENLLPEYIKKNVEVAGVIGEFAGDEAEKTVELAMTDGDQVIEADADTVLTKVTVRKPETMIPENIADGVNIGGVIGTFKAVQAPHQLIDGTGELFEIVDESFDIPPVAVKSGAFASNAGITKAVMSGVLEIGASAFNTCPNLKEASFENCETVGSYAFHRCYELECVSFPRCTKIETSGFYWCSSIKKMELPNLISCAAYAFYNCSNMTEVNIEKLTRLPTGMFDGCGNLESIVFANEISAFGMYAIRGTAYYSNVAERVSNVLYVKNVAVSGLSTTGISGVLTFRDGTTCVGGDGFYACSKITGISCEGMKWIGESAFRSCSYITSISMPEVVQIGASAFMNCYRLKSAIFPKCIELGSYAFQYCSALSVVEIPLCESIGYSTFQNCSMLASIDFPNCLSVGTNAFINCSALTEAEFPVCTMVGISAFCSCIKLSVANFQECSFVQSNAFNSCKALTAISFPKCTTVGSSAFKACSALIEAVFPMCEFVSSCAFQACSLLKTVDLGVCSQIAYSAFWACSALEKIILRSTAVCNLTSSSAFYATKIYSKTGKIYVPSSLVASYKAATNWKYFSTIISAIESMEV